ncbi:hypothetical protein Hypma_013111 [Hypsizygus marmoreus]|uniref:Uncharacterized protein n=1 Tax=Hypsizygus marmoreus TaxID=39966 RepID=A0A369JFR9_HYPMA|nr:hypothetical protein Hypma_013111 [Hypsizygus marmoreus]
MVLATSVASHPSAIESTPSSSQMATHPTQTQLSPTPLLSSVDEVKDFLSKSIEDKKPVFASFHVSEDDLETIHQALQRPEYCKFRISCSDTHNLTLRLMPSLAHDMAAGEVSAAILSSICTDSRMPPTFERLKSIAFTLSATRKLDKPEKLYKQPDASFTGRQNLRFPLVVIEVGVPEKMAELQGDASHWLLSTQVKMAIVIFIGPEARVLDKDGLPMPQIGVRHYEKYIPENPQRSKPQEAAQATLDIHWTNEDEIKDYVLPGCHFFSEGTPEYMAFAVDNHHITVKRQDVLLIREAIRDAWREDHIE